MPKTVANILERIRGTVLNADEAEQVIEALQARIRDSEERLMLLNIKRAISGHSARAGKLTDEQFQRILAVVMPHLADNARTREKDLLRAFRSTALQRHPFTGSGPIAPPGKGNYIPPGAPGVRISQLADAVITGPVDLPAVELEDTQHDGLVPGPGGQRIKPYSPPSENPSFYPQT